MVVVIEDVEDEAAAGADTEPVATAGPNSALENRGLEHLDEEIVGLDRSTKYLENQLIGWIFLPINEVLW